MKRPYAAGEIAYFRGNNSDHAWIGGEMAMTGKIGALKSYAKYLKYLIERYRWNDVAMISPGLEKRIPGVLERNVRPCSIHREYNVSFFSGQTVTGCEVFNDTFSLPRNIQMDRKCKWQEHSIGH